jgi:glycosyltransferase involved in cell wall biosynthesis
VVKPERTPVRIAYLLSQYPAVNHVFMTREVRLLRRCGLEIHAFSIGGPDRPLAAMTDVEREEVLATYYVKNAGFLQLAGAQVSTLFSRPISYSRGLWCAVRMGMWSPRGMLYGVFYFGEAILIGRSMMHQGLRHLHTHFASTVALIVARTFPVTMSATFHGPMEFENPAAFRLREKIRASLFSCAISRYGLSQLMYVSGRSQWSKLEWTPLGVDPAEFVPRPFRSDPSPFQIVCVGRLAPVKGQHVLIGAVAALVRDGHEILLRFVGDGPDRSELEREVEARGLSRSVFFTGNVNQDELRAIYRGSDALVLSSFGEGLPVVLMEAMAMEVPCVATWVAGVPELIRDGANGLLIPPADEGSLAGAILRLMSDPDLRFKLGREARRTVLDQYDLDKNGERLAEIFRRRLDVRQPGRNLNSPTRGASSI